MKTEERIMNVSKKSPLRIFVQTSFVYASANDNTILNFSGLKAKQE